MNLCSIEAKNETNFNEFIFFNEKKSIKSTTPSLKKNNLITTKTELVIIFFYFSKSFEFKITIPPPESI